MSTWVERKQAELVAKIESINEELAFWRSQTDDKGLFAKHHTQVERVADGLNFVVARVRDDIDRRDMSSNWQILERRVLELHRVWDFFREKLILRYVEPFQDYLLAADEFAWACYKPLRDHVVATGTVGEEAVREPPLVCFTSVSSPFSIPRGTSYAVDVGGAALSTEASRRLVERLPVPVVGIPWYQLNHLPDMLVVGHEVGHHAERDGRLTGSVRRLVEEATGECRAEAQRRDDWSRWAAEAFADVYGVLCGGPAFARALGDFLVVATAREEAGQGDYPPVRIRVALALAALESAASQAGAASSAAGRDAVAELRDSWRRDGIEVDAGNRTAEVNAVANLLVTGPYRELGGVPLTKVVSFGEQRLMDHRRDAEALLDGRGPATKDARTLLAAAGRAYAQDPRTYYEQEVPQRVLRRMREIQDPGTRDIALRASKDQATIDAKIAEQLYELLVTSTQEERSI